MKSVHSRTADQPFRWRDLASGHTLFFIVLVISAYLALVVALAPLLLSPTGKNDQYVVVLPPWASLDRIFAVETAVNGRVIGLNDKTNTFLLFVDRPDAVAALHEAGAWLVLDPEKLGGFEGCAPPAIRRGPRASSKAVQ